MVVSDDDAPLSEWRARQQRARSAAGKTSVMPPDSPRVETSDVAAEQDAVELQELELAARRLEFQAAQWKQQLALRKERLQLKSEEINGKETLTRQQQQVEAMEIRARVLRALGEVHKTPEQIREYLVLLEG